MKISRRTFLRGSVAATTASLASHPLSAQSIEHSDYKALVIVFLFGGNDAFNTIIPLSSARYSEYAQIRGHLGVPKSEILNTGLQTWRKEDVGIHQSLSPLLPLFERGDANVILTSGQLIEPTNAAKIAAESVRLPEFLMAHNTQQQMWQAGATNLTRASGWAGRMLDKFANHSSVTPLFSITGDNLLLRGDRVRQSVLSTKGVGNYPAWQRLSAFRDGYFGHFTDETYPNIYSRQYAKSMRNGVLENEFLSATLEQFPALDSMPQSRLGGQLSLVERLIRANQTLEQPRQVFLVGMGGFDTHKDQADRHPALLSEVAEALAAFQDNIAAQGLSNAVTTITMSDFGRRAQPNATGTDHGWAGHQIVLGGSVRTKRAFGRFPELNSGSARDYKNGRIIPLIAADRVNASLCRWFGLPEADIMEIFPNIKNFKTPYVSFI